MSRSRPYEIKDVVSFKSYYANHHHLIKDLVTPYINEKVFHLEMPADGSGHPNVLKLLQYIFKSIQHRDAMKAYSKYPFMAPLAKNTDITMSSNILKYNLPLYSGLLRVAIGQLKADDIPEEFVSHLCDQDLERKTQRCVQEYGQPCHLRELAKLQLTCALMHQASTGTLADQDQDMKEQEEQEEDDDDDDEEEEEAEWQPAPLAPWAPLAAAPQEQDEEIEEIEKVKVETKTQQTKSKPKIKRKFESLIDKDARWDEEEGEYIWSPLPQEQDDDNDDIKYFDVREQEEAEAQEKRRRARKHRKIIHKLDLFEVPLDLEALGKIVVKQLPLPSASSSSSSSDAPSRRQWFKVELAPFEDDMWVNLTMDQSLDLSILEQAHEDMSELFTLHTGIEEEPVNIKPNMVLDEDSSYLGLRDFLLMLVRKLLNNDVQAIKSLRITRGVPWILTVFTF
jgi:hypothetical protein